MFKGSIVILFSALLIAALASCGDDEDSSSDSSGSASISHAEFVREAERICIRASDNTLAEVGAYVKRQEQAGGGGQGQSDLQAEAVRDVILPSVESQIDEIRALDAPSGDEEQVKGFLKALEDAVDVAREKPLTPRANAAFSRVNRVGRAYGLERCAYG